ncbi:hypothetical protein [Sporosarcina sp. NPDC096371]
MRVTRLLPQDVAFVGRDLSACSSAIFILLFERLFKVAVKK